MLIYRHNSNALIENSMDHTVKANVNTRMAYALIVIHKKNQVTGHKSFQRIYFFVQLIIREKPAAPWPCAVMPVNFST